EGYKWWVGFMEKYYPEGDKTDVFNVYGPSVSATTVQVLKQCGDELTRENIMKQAANLHDFTVPMLLPGIKINTSPTDFVQVKQGGRAEHQRAHQIVDRQPQQDHEADQERRRLQARLLRRDDPDQRRRGQRPDDRHQLQHADRDRQQQRVRQMEHRAEADPGD